MLANFCFICVAILVSRLLGAPRYRYRQSTTYVLAMIDIAGMLAPSPPSPITTTAYRYIVVFHPSTIPIRVDINNRLVACLARRRRLPVATDRGS
jgi:hypothetical protein